MPADPEQMALIRFFVIYGPIILLIGAGFLAGKLIERRHLKDMDRRDGRPGLSTATNLRTPPETAVRASFLVMGSTVIASDYYKTLGARLKTLVGGRLGTLESLVERGRREAILRMREQAASAGAQLVINVRIETSTIARSDRAAAMPSVEVLAYGTALVLASY